MKKWISVLLLLAMLIGVLASCGNKNGATTETDGDTSTIPEGDGWVDVWDEDPAFTPLTNDKELDTAGQTANGSWFDSFKSSKNFFWVSDTAGAVTYQNGCMDLVATDPYSSVTVSRAVTAADHFEAEIRLKMDYFGNANAFYLSMNGKRAVVYLYESKLRVGMESEDSNSVRAEHIYVDVGYDWHTYRLVGRDELVDLYMDGVLLLTFEMQQTGVKSGFGIFADPISEFSPTECQIEYVSYTVMSNNLLQITSPAKGAICGVGTVDVVVNCEVSSKLESTGETILFYLNDIYVGSTKTEQPTITLKGLTAGVYSIWAKCGDTISAERIFYVNREESGQKVTPVYSNETRLTGSYVLRFEVTGNGEVSSSDGYYPLHLRFENGQICYDTANGVQQSGGGNGTYVTVVDGGVAWLYRNGRMLASYRLPYSKGKNGISMSDGINDLTIEANGATYYEKNFNGDVSEDFDINNLPYNYALEFEYTRGNALEVSLSDSAYLMRLSLETNGGIVGVVAPHLEAFEEVLTQALDGTHLYRITVSNGIGQLFADNVWLASWRLPRTVAECDLFVCGNGVGMMRITELKDWFCFSSDVSASDWEQYFTETVTAPWTAEAKALKVYSADTEICAELHLSSQSKGSFYLVAKYFDGNADVAASGVIAGIDLDNGCFQIGTSYQSLKTVREGIPLNAETALLRLVVIGDSATLFWNDVAVGSMEIGLNGWGNVGYINALDGGMFSAFSYEGDGNPLCKSDTLLVKDQHTVGIFELNNKIYLVDGDGYTRESSDGGENWTLTQKSSYFGYNTIVLQSGKVLTLKRMFGSNGMKYYAAYVSDNNGTTWRGPYAVNEDQNTYRFTMNGKVMQTSSGRIFFVSGETENENIGTLWIYYSDNDGLTWKRSASIFDQKNTGENLQEGAIVELSDGVLRMYARNDGGFLMYSDSHDNGKTWDLKMKNSPFASVVSAFGVRNDPSTGAIYLCWEYNCINDATVIQYPRTRVGLAVSYDGAETWYYVGDIDEFNHISYTDFCHMNIGVWVTSDSVFATAAKDIGGTWYNYTVRIQKDGIQPSVRLNSLHGFCRNSDSDKKGIWHLTNGVLTVSASTGRVYASGTYYKVESVDGKRTQLSLEMIADFLHGTLSLENGRGVISVGNTDYVFTAESKTARINGQDREMVFETTLRDGMLWITVEDFDSLFELTARCASNGNIVITADDAAVSLEFLLVNTGIW